MAMCSTRLLVLLLLFSLSLLVSAQFQNLNQNGQVYYEDPNDVPLELFKRGPFQFHAARGKRGEFRNSKYSYFPSRGRRSQIEANE